MLYRFTFTATSGGTLRVTGVASGWSMVLAIHSNDRALISAVKAANITPFQRLRLLEAVVEARRQPGVDICCEAVKLTEKQVELLGLCQDA